MKLSPTTKRKAARTRPEHYAQRPEHYVRPERVLPEHVEAVQQEIPTDDATAFLMLVADSAGLQRKDFQYGMSVSKELVKLWFEGTRRNPLKAARDCVAIFPPRLVPTILEYIAGADFAAKDACEYIVIRKPKGAE